MKLKASRGAECHGFYFGLGGGNMIKVIFIAFALGLLLSLSGCSSNSTSNADWNTIDAQEANRMMLELDDFILLDVRTVSEFEQMRIEGAIHIPYNEITDRAEAELKDKNSVILIYCRSGQRSALAAANLIYLGFTAIYDFGGILNWPYETVGG